MYTVTRTQGRPDTTVNFYIPQWALSTEEEIAYCTHFATEYVQTFAWLTAQFEYSDDGLTCTMTNIWQSEEDYLKFKEDPMGLAKFESLVNANCLKNNITHTIVSEASS
jgi:hypothetical protein